MWSRLKRAIKTIGDCVSNQEPEYQETPRQGISCVRAYEFSVFKRHDKRLHRAVCMFRPTVLAVSRDLFDAMLEKMRHDEDRFFEVSSGGMKPKEILPWNYDECVHEIKYRGVTCRVANDVEQTRVSMAYLIGPAERVLVYRTGGQV